MPNKFEVEIRLADNQVSLKSFETNRSCILGENRDCRSREAKESKAILRWFQKQQIRNYFPSCVYTDRPDSQLPPRQKRENGADLPVQDQVNQHDEGVWRLDGENRTLYWLEKWQDHLSKEVLLLGHVEQEERSNHFEDLVPCESMVCPQNRERSPQEERRQRQWIVD